MSRTKFNGFEKYFITTALKHAIEEAESDIKKMEEDGILLPVIELKINFKQPALFDDKLTIKTKLKRAPSYMIEFDFEIKRDDKVITLGYSKLIFLNSKTNKPMRCPKNILSELIKVS